LAGINYRSIYAGSKQMIVIYLWGYLPRK